MSKCNKSLILASHRGYYVTIKGLLLTPKGNVASTYLNNSGYHTYNISIRTQNTGRNFHFGVHRLQAYQKFGLRLFDPGIVVRHIDGNKLNNSWYNIEVGTLSQNSLDRTKEDRIKYAKLAANKLRKLSDKDVDNLRKDRLNGFTYKEICKKYKIAKSTVSYIVNNKTYSQMV